MNETITVIRYELSMSDMMTGKLTEAGEAANNLVGGLDNIAKQAENVGDKAEKVGKLKERLDGIAEASAKIGEAFGISFDPSKGLDFIKEAGEDYEKLQLAQSQVEAGLESTQHAAGLSFGELKEQAEQAGNSVNFSAQQITNMQAVLLTFPAVTKQTFADASTAIEDMATRTGQDLSSTAKQVGKALQDPTKGLTSLGLNFNDSQEQVIKKLAETGHTAQAQALIIKEMNSEFGGSAAAAAAADPYFKFKGSIDEVKTSIGSLVVKIKEHLAPILETVAGKVAEVVGWMMKHKAIVEGVASVMGPLVAVLLGVAGAVKTWAAVQEILDIALINNPIGIIITAIATATGFVIYLYTHFDKCREVIDGVWNVIKNFGTFLKDVFIGILGGLGEAILGIRLFSPSLIADGLKKASAAGADIGKMYSEGYNKSVAESRTKKEEDDAISGFRKYHNGLSPDEWQRNELLKKSTDGIAGIGKNVLGTGTQTQSTTGNKSTATTINIKIGDLVKELNVHSTTIQSGAKQIQQLITEVLLGAVNDSQRIAHD